MKLGLFIILVVTMAGSAGAAFPPWPYVNTMTGPATTACVLIVPGGGGPPLTAARLPDGTPVDGSIHLQLVDGLGIPYAHFAGNDIWLEFAGAAAALGNCQYHLSLPGGQFTPGNSSDQNGWVHFTNPLSGGGWAAGPVTVFINGTAALMIGDVAWPSLPLQVNSPDLNGDRVVNLTDVGLFAGDLFGAFHLRSDLQRDGVLNLSDIAVLAGHLGTGCP